MRALVLLQGVCFKDQLIASDFKAHTVTLDLSKDFVADDQTLFWQIDAPGGGWESGCCGLFAYDRLHVDVAKGTSTAAVTGAASFDIFVRNDGDLYDEAAETFDIKIGYVIGDNKAEQIEIGLPDTSVGAAATAFSGAAAVLDLDEADTTKADSYSTNSTTASVTLSDGATTVDFALTPATTGTSGTDEKITSVDVGSAANLTSLKNDGGALKVLVTDTAGNKVDIGHTVLKGTGTNQAVKITASDLVPICCFFRELLSRAS